MIGYLEGTIHHLDATRAVIIAGGVGYDVRISLQTYYALEGTRETALDVYTHVREDTIALFGFATPLELELFERLIAINGVGPKLALAVLSGIDAPELVRAVRLQDVARLMAIPGIGRKTAERIGLELKDRLPKSLQVETARPRSPEDELRDDVMSALLNLGYQRGAAEKALERVAADGGSFQDVLKRVLRALAK